MPRRSTVHNKRDECEPAIVAALADMGVDWLEAGPLDGWVYLGQWIPVENKMPGMPFTPLQTEFIDACKRMDRPHLVWRCVDDAINTVNIYREHYS